MNDSRAMSPWRLVAIPALVTLAVTLLRLTGELLGWAPALFSKAPGGGGSLVGIAWLVPVFGAWFGWKLARAAEIPGRPARGFLLLVLAAIVMPLAGVLASKLGVPPTSLATLAIFVTVSVAALLVGYAAWPALGRVLLAYGLAARIPVVLVMLAAILGDWGTHYDVMPPGTPEMSGLWKWFVIGVLPQLTIWLWFTSVLGGLTGLAAGAVVGRRSRR